MGLKAAEEDQVNSTYTPPPGPRPSLGVRCPFGLAPWHCQRESWHKLVFRPRADEGDSEMPILVSSRNTSRASSQTPWC